ncbi:arginine--tRNA ligase [Candidatus Nitrosocosmicus arcticus]|uniref:arginine--tRNA ligase n=1 Tax=Candidatus Nitrosocosmicus arcticus TaxID=2035267 RepID=A0A557STE0_9ARCH|nr:arginine--tRNA ligase [Candidatus Nitrosocosmicus arcticus]TVP39869.1 Arginine-tRNA ligase [Candidatus Nitrosocosmicus arcticus]
MIVEDVINEINRSLEVVLTYYNLNRSEVNFEITEPHVKDFGDFSTNICFLLAKKLKKSPNEIADHIVNTILPTSRILINNNGLIETVSFINPGFINFKINNKVFVNEFFKEGTNNSKFDTENKNISNSNELILIEHTSVNPNKALHVGHLRNAIIGDCLYRILRTAGKDVRVINYIDDSGVQVADIIVGFRHAGFSTRIDGQELSREKTKFDHYCGNEIYVKTNELYKSRPDLEIKRKTILKELEDPESETSHFTKTIVDRVLKDQLETCWNLRCRYDLLCFESQIVQSNLWNYIFSILRDKGIIYYEKVGKNSDCWVYKSTKEGDKVLVRSDSTLTYFAKDIPFAVWKLGYLRNPFDYVFYATQWDSSILYRTKIKEKRSGTVESSFDFEKESLIDFNKISKVITIIDSRQERLQNLLVEILGKLGMDSSKYKYLGYEPVILSQSSLDNLGISVMGKNSLHMSGRKGIYIEADIALSNLEERSRVETRNRNPELSEEEIAFISKEISISAVRYFFIKFDFGKMITFDIKESLSLEGDTASYIQYAYARGKRVEDKIIEASFLKIQNNVENKVEITDFSSTEIELIKHICRYDIELRQAANSIDPKVLSKYLFHLATLFNNFYEKSPILKEKNVILATYRALILNNTLQILKRCMSIIGITPLKRM